MVQQWSCFIILQSSADTVVSEAVLFLRQLKEVASASLCHRDNEGNSAWQVFVMGGRVSVIEITCFFP